MKIRRETEEERRDHQQTIMLQQLPEAVDNWLSCALFPSLSVIHHFPFPPILSLFSPFPLQCIFFFDSFSVLLILFIFLFFFLFVPSFSFISSQKFLHLPRYSKIEPPPPSKFSSAQSHCCNQQALCSAGMDATLQIIVW